MSKAILCSGSTDLVIKVSFLSVILTIYHFPAEFSDVLFTGLFALQLTEEFDFVGTSLSTTSPGRSCRTQNTFPGAWEAAQGPA